MINWKRIVKASLEEVKPKIASFHSDIVERGGSETYHLAEGDVMYMDSVILAGGCRVKMYTTNNGTRHISGCYIDACRRPEDTGDFRLPHCLLASDHERVIGQEHCLAHLGLDQIHCGGAPMKIDFGQ
jgi:hypothetical protein